MSLDNFVVARLPFSNEIVIGKLNKSRKEFLDKKIVTEQVMAVVIEYMLEGLSLKEHVQELTFDNGYCFEITVKKLIKAKEL